MCDNCKTFFLTPKGWIEADEAPPDAVGKDTFHEAEKMYQSGYWDRFQRLPSATDDELVKRLRKEFGRHAKTQRAKK